MTKVEKLFESWGFLGFFSFFFALFLLVPYATFLSLGFTSDGLHLYSALRNTIEGHGFFFEGPTFENLLGTHAYLSSLILAPLIWVFRSPLVLAYASPFCHLLGTYLFFKILCKLDKERKARTFISLLAILYFLYPSAFFMMQSYYLFFPDQLLEPFFLLGFYLFLRGRLWLAAAIGFLILLTKEEYLPLFPFLFAFTLHCIRPKGPWLRLSIVTAVLTILGSAFSLLTLKHYRGLNTLSFGVRGIELSFGMPLSDALNSIWILIKPVTFVLIFAFYRKVGRHRAAAFWIFFFLAYRCAFDVVAYQKIPHYHWGNGMLLTTFFLSTGFLLVPEVAQLSLKDRRIFASLCVLTMIFCLPDLRRTGTWGLIANTLRNGGPWNRELADELTQVRSQMKPPAGYEYFIAPQYLVGPFMERSHLSLELLMSDGEDNIPLDRRAPLMKSARYAILPKEEREIGAKKLAQDNQPILFETTHFLLYGKP